MDDLAKKLSDLLNSPDGLQKIQSAAASLGMLSGTDSTGAGNPPPSSAESVPAASLSSPPAADNNPLGDMEMISKLLPLLSTIKGDDDNTILLKALRPYLQDERQQRLDETIKIMHLLKALPMLGDKGIL